MGPIALVDTITAGIDLDVQRALYMGPGKTMTFMVPDSTQPTNWRTVLTVIKGFHRITGQERTTEDGSEVIFRIADPDEVLRPVLAMADLHVEVEEIIYSVARVPPVASSQAQVFNLTCKIRPLRTRFVNTK